MSARPSPWERRDDESPPAWEAFTVYRDMGTDRNLSAVAEKLGKSRSLITRWSTTHSWVLRTDAFDRNEDRLHLKRIREARRKTAKTNLALAEQIMVKVQASLESLPEGKLSPGDMARLMTAASQLQRLALTDGAVGAPAGGAPEAGGAGARGAADMTDEARRARMELLQRELQSRLADHDAAVAL